MERNRRYATTALMIAVTGYGLLFILNRATAQEAEKDTSFYPIFEETVRKYHQEDYDASVQLAIKLREEYPDTPAGVFALLANYQTLMRNYRVRIYEAQYDSLIELCIKLTQKSIKNLKKDGRNYFYLGCVYGSRSIYYARRGKLMSAFKDGSKVLTNFKKALAYDPEFYDSYYGLGLYNYWLGAKAKFLRFLSFSKDRRHEGIEQIKLAIAKGRFLYIDGMYGLTTIYYNEGDYEKALEINDKLYQKYPTNPSLLYMRGRIYQALQRWSEALNTFETLYSLLKTAKYKSTSYQVECLFQMAKSQYHLGNFLETQRLCQEAIALNKNCDFSKELDGPLEKFSEIENQLHKLNDEVEEIMIAQVNGKIKN